MSDVKQINNSNKQIKNGAIVSYATILFNILAGLIYTPWLIKQIGQSNYGLYILAISIIGFIAMDFGLDGAVSRFVSKYIAEGDTRNVENFLGFIYKMFILIDAVIFVTLIIIFFFIQNIYVELTPSEIEKLKILYIIAGLFSVVTFPFIPMNGILVSYEKFSFYKLTTLFQKVFSVLLMVISLSIGYGLYSIVIVNSVVGIIILLLKFYYIKKTINVKVNLRYFDKDMFKQVIGFLIWSTVIIFAERFILNITPTVLGVLAGSIAIAIFSVGVTIEGYTYTFAQAINGLFLPKVSKMIADKKMSVEFENLMIKVGRIQLFVSGIIIIGFISLGQEFMGLWVGEQFNDSYIVGVLLIVPYAISLTQEIGNTMLFALNKVKYRAIAIVITAIISFVLSIFLSKLYGAIGSAIAIFIGRILGTLILMNIVYYKVLKINVFRFFRECHLKIFIPLVITCVIGLVIQYLLPTEFLWVFTLKVIFLLVLYFIFLWLISFNQFEKNLIFGLTNKIKIKFNRR
jgi:O-antigen/teichoic acid export membrane protein